MYLCARVCTGLCVHECWCPRETGGLGSFGAGVTGGCGMSGVSRIADALFSPQLFIYLFFWTCTKCPLCLTMRTWLVMFAASLWCLMKYFLQMDTQYPYSVAHTSVTFPFLEYYYKDTMPAVCLTLPSSLLKGEQRPHQLHALLRQCLPVSYTPPFVIVVLWFFFSTRRFQFPGVFEALLVPHPCSLLVSSGGFRCLPYLLGPYASSMFRLLCILHLCPSCRKYLDVALARSLRCRAPVGKWTPLTVPPPWFVLKNIRCTFPCLVPFGSLLPLPHICWFPCLSLRKTLVRCNDMCL